MIAAQAHYGVPQARQRVFILAAKRGWPLPKPPPPRFHWPVARGISDFGQVVIESHSSMPPPVTVLATIDDLNPLKDGDQEAQRNGADKLAVLGHDVSLYEIPPRNGYQEKLRTRRDNTALGVNSVLHNHWSETAKEAAKALEASAAVYPTVIGRSTHLHPQHPRPLTIRERARACALPDWVELRGSLASQAKQVGNLVRTNERTNELLDEKCCVCVFSLFFFV